MGTRLTAQVIPMETLQEPDIASPSAFLELLQTKYAEKESLCN